MLDYRRLSDIVTLSSSVSEQCVSVDIIDDSVFEKTESLRVDLSLLNREDNGVQFKHSSAEIIISDKQENGEDDSASRVVYRSWYRPSPAFERVWLARLHFIDCMYIA